MTTEILRAGNPNAPILVVVDPPSYKAAMERRVMPLDQLTYFAQQMQEQGLGQQDFAFVCAAPSMPSDVFASKARQNRFLKEHRENFLQTCANFQPRMILTLGGLAANQVSGRSIQITKVRGVFTQYSDFNSTSVLHMYAPGYVIRQPQNEPSFLADVRTLRTFIDRGFNPEGLGRDNDLEYNWATDLTDWVNDPPRVIAADTETTGLIWYRPEVVPFMFQMCREPGKAVAVPLLQNYYPDLSRDHMHLFEQVKWILENPDIKKVGHNFKFDYHMLRKLGINVQGWVMDTQQAAFCVNENLRNKSLSECVRLWVPEMAGYSDEFDRTVDKSRMIEVPYDDVLEYGCGDADADYRLAKVLQAELAKDRRQYFLFQKVQMPALKAFADTLEFNGVYINEQRLGELGSELEVDERRKYDQLIRHTPGIVKVKHLNQGKELKFSRTDFVRDILFTPEGFNLTPQVYTKTTQRLPDDQKIPSTSSKDHLPYFKHFEVNGFKYVEALIDYSKLQKVRTTYVGVPADENGQPTGFWQYIYDGKIHPSYRLDNTVTGRTSSDNPSGQNIPKHGQYAKAYRKIFVAPPGWTLIQADYSQAELRIAAWVANELRMLEAYRLGRDIHALTAAALSRMSFEEFLLLPEEEIEDKRHKAKSANFGLLYGLQAASYKEYAYTNYGLTLTMEEAERDRILFFEMYPALPAWHEATKMFVREHGYVRALHGAVRHLPDIYSQDYGVQSGAERQAINSPIQRFASDLGVMSLSRIHRDLQRAENIPLLPCMFIHDALVFMCPDEYVDEAMSAIKFYMESNPLESWFGLQCPIPIIADLEAGKTLADLSKRSDVVAQAPSWYNGEE